MINNLCFQWLVQSAELFFVLYSCTRLTNTLYPRATRLSNVFYGGSDPNRLPSEENLDTKLPVRKVLVYFLSSLISDLSVTLSDETMQAGNENRARSHISLDISVICRIEDTINVGEGFGSLCLMVVTVSVNFFFFLQRLTAFTFLFAITLQK